MRDTWKLSAKEKKQSHDPAPAAEDLLYSMKTTTEKQKTIKRVAVKHGDCYCVLNKDFHALGVLLPEAKGIDSAHLFPNSAVAGYAIARTQEAIDAAKASQFPAWKAFERLYKARPFAMDCEEVRIPAE